MNSFCRDKGLLFSAIVALGTVGCAASTPVADPQARATVAAEALTIVQCQIDVADCIKNAGNLADVDACRGDFFACAETAAGEVKDAVADVGATIKDKVADVTADAKALAGDVKAAAEACRNDTTACVSAAASVADVLACRTEFEACVDGLVATPPDVNPPKVVLPHDLPDLSVVTDCPTTALECVRTAASHDDVEKCRTGFESCLGDLAANVVAEAKALTGDAKAAAEDAIDQVTSVANLPQTDEVLAAADACKADAEACVHDALDGSVDLAACRAGFESCVDGLVATLP